jgi:predicted HAD superfamily Cof-like phosphohydrolase
MNQWQKDVQDFHEKFGAKVGNQPNFDERELRAKLIMEEAVETVAAMGFSVFATIDDTGVIGRRAFREVARYHGSHVEPNMVETIDGLCDLIYVTVGSAVSMGIDLSPFFNEVHRSNMAKVGGATRADGKILKPEGWTAPDIYGLLGKVKDPFYGR